MSESNLILLIVFITLTAAGVVLDVKGKDVDTNILWIINFLVFINLVF